MRAYLKDILRLRSNADFEKTKTTIADDVEIKGYNLWMLLCSSILASIGLDTNSAAIIIGAMLISPLMSPILCVGMSVAIHDQKLLLCSMKNLGVAVLIALSASTVFFFLTPLRQVTSEELARTYPTLLDVMVAFFGGIAGIISISRQEPTNAVPGVAIATALMPPLCTAGFGIATGHWNYFFGAFYLFLLNAVFISLATYLIVKYLHFPSTHYRNPRLERLYSTWFKIISVVALLPSIYFLYTVYQREKIKSRLDELVIAPIRQQGNEILKWELSDRDSVIWIKIYHSGRPLSDQLKNNIHQNLAANRMKRYELHPLRVNMTKEEVNELSEDVARHMFQQMQLQTLSDERDRMANSRMPQYVISDEVKTAFPFIDTLYHGWMIIPDTLKGVDTLPIVFYTAQRGVTPAQQEQLYRFLKLRMAKDTVAMVRR